MNQSVVREYAYHDLHTLTDDVRVLLTFGQHVLDRDRGFAHGKGLAHVVLSILPSRLQLLVLRVELGEDLLHREGGGVGQGVRVLEAHQAL